MAPTSRTGQVTAGTRSMSLRASFGRVTKSSKLNTLPVKPTQKQGSAIAALLTDQDQVRPAKQVEVPSSTQICSTKLTSGKRKREDDSDEEEELKEEASIVVKTKMAMSTKKQKVQLLSPPPSQYNTDSESVRSPTRTNGSSRSRSLQTTLRSIALPQRLQDLVSLHAAFLKALSIHYAHNGPATPAELTTLMSSTTRLWKRSAVIKENVQQMLAVYEVAAHPSSLQAKTVKHQHSPFQLCMSGFGGTIRINVEFVAGSQSGIFKEQQLQQAYEEHIRTIFDKWQSGQPESIHESSIPLPSLSCSLGRQTQVRQAKVSAARQELLQLASAAQARSQPDFSKLSISDPLDHTPSAVKSRTSSLFDRVRAKGLASSATCGPTSEQLLRRRAICRIPEVVDLLRMKQQQKLAAQFTSDSDDSSSQLKAKISFSLGGIIHEIRQSVGIPLGVEEVRMCMSILEKDVPGGWLAVHEFGTVQSITLQGNGLSGSEVKRMLDEKAQVTL